ncbi:acyltransferase family protein [Pedobacter antarcticus]|uniref:acyltransferase family protein n=1 Tax=Pedobacter antarcticus TaxID=34086 RepID=UPI000883D528|nr:acyltransferase [Pedobacter antarcticus]SDL69611.1 Surface polysaccharide O-acyltransferase, integral membrane enzyme [Pedobacter antarcticus]
MNSPINRTSNTLRYPWLDYLRGFLTLLVVAHHSSLAYTTFANFNKEMYVSSTNPVVDITRWLGMDYFEDFNDIFFMALMFLIGGIFLMSSIQKKGQSSFISDRFYRLFIPFLFGSTVLMLIAYLPSYYLAYGNFNLRSYIIDFFTVESWPAGPMWFIWLLFLFNLVFAILFPLVKSLMKRIGRSIGNHAHRPLKIILGFYLIAWLSYVPMVMLSGAGTWTGVGPFDFQVSRVLLYFSFFIIGIILGTSGIDQGIFGENSFFVKKWFLWVAGCILTYLLLKSIEAPLTLIYKQQKLSEVQAFLIYRSIWILSCVFSSLAFLVLFRKVFNSISPWWQKLSDNAYGIYLIHYIFVVWCQFVLTYIDLPVIVKFTITFVISVGASWAVSFFLGKIEGWRRCTNKEITMPYFKVKSK